MASLLGQCVAEAASIHRPQLPSHTPHEIILLLNDWCTLMFDAILAQGGTVPQLTGDGLMAMFEAPLPAVQAAREMVDMAALFNAERLAVRRVPITMGLGIARGAMVAGTAGSAQRAAYACVGAPLRRAVLMESESARGGHKLLLDAATQAGLAGRVATVAVKLQGKESAFTIG